YELARKGNVQKALERYEEAVRLAPQHAGIWQEYALCLRKTYHLQRAVRATWRAMELRGETAALWANQGNAYIAAEAWKAAWTAYEKAATLSNDKRWSAKNFLNLGYRQWLVGDNDGATKSFQHAVKLDANNGLGVLDLACVQATQGKTQEALRQIGTAKRLFKAEGDKRGLAYAQSVEKTIKRAGRLDPPTQFVSFEQLPQRFLTQPPKGQALSLKIDATVRRSFRLPGGTVMSIAVKESWKTRVDTKMVRGVATISFAPAKGDDFLLLWTPLPGPARPLNILKSSLEKTKKKQLSAAVEKDPVIKELKSESMRGYYFLMTDRSLVGKPPTEGQYLYGIFCMLRAGKVDSTLTILSRKNDEQFVKELTQAVSSISSDRKAADMPK
ncbi:hypothetical protein LCGC14_2535960, partial [marine sediment metagenome]